MYVIKNLRRANAENYMFRNQTQLQVCKNALHTYWVYTNLGLLAVANFAPSLGQIPRAYHQATLSVSQSIHISRQC